MAVSDTPTSMDERVGATQRAIESRIASAFVEDMQITESAPDFYRVRTAGGEYVVDMRDGVGTCSCEDATYRTNDAASVLCKHGYAIKHFHRGETAGGDW